MARAIPYLGVTMNDLKELLQESATQVNVHFDRYAEGEYVRVMRYDLGTNSTVISGLIQGVTFSLDVPEQLDDEGAARIALATINAIRENVFLGPGACPGQDTIGLSSRMRAQ